MKKTGKLQSQNIIERINKKGRHKTKKTETKQNKISQNITFKNNAIIQKC